MLKAYIKLIRPGQWVKNGVVLAGLIFAGEAANADKALIAFQALIAFCLLASSVYVLNDIKDHDRDRLHPLKKDRPLASGKISVTTAAIIGIVFFLGGMALAVSINYPFTIVAALYVLINLLYTFLLKNIVIIDVMTIAAGFVLRAIAGAVAINVDITTWLLIATFVLALFLAFGKRRHEITFLEDGGVGHREILRKYSPYLLDQLIGVVTASTVVTYFFYTISPEVALKLGTQYLVITVPFVIYGIFRYLYLVHSKKQGGSPTRLLLTDLPLLIDVLLWLATVVLILYIL